MTFEKHKDLIETEIQDHQEVEDILKDFFPEYERVFLSTPVEGDHKYDWEQYIVIKWFDKLYLINFTFCSNGGYYSDCHSQRITSVVENVQRKVEIIEHVYYE